MNALKTLKKILKPLASLYLTVPLLLLSMLLIYAGTTVQKQMSIQDVQKHFFHSWFAWVPLDASLRPFADAASPPLFRGGFYTVGGYSLIVLLLANLLAAHGVRFKLNWKRSGIILIHLGLIVLLLGEVFASLFSVESQMMIDQGQTVQHSYDIRHVELAVIDPSPTDHDDVTVIDSSGLKPGAVIRSAALPFEIQVDDYFANSSLLGPAQTSTRAVARATAGNNRSLRVVPEGQVAGTESEQDIASAFVTVVADGKTFGTYLLTQWANSTINRPKTSPYFGMIAGGPQRIEVNGKTYELDLRFRRDYKPYQITLLRFSHDRYPGTDMPRNFSSRIRLVDPTRNVDREVLIWMNHPLTYPSLRGETFYQQSFLPGDATTILQVTHNPAWPLPYLGLALGFVGMLVHFGMNLTGFLRRRAVGRAPAPPVRGRRAQPVAVASRLGESGLSSYRLEPRSRARALYAAALGAGLCLVLFGYVLATPMALENGFDLAEFSRLPVNFGGRPMPMDTLARIGLKIISERETLTDPADAHKTLHAVRWLADTMADVPGAFNYRVIRIAQPDILSQLDLDATQKYFSLNDLLAHRDTIQKQFDLAIGIPEKQRDDYQRHIVELAQHVEQYLELRQVGRMLLVPPARDDGEQWLAPEAGGGELLPGSRAMIDILQHYHEDQPREFNAAVAGYHTALEKQLPSTMAKADFEVFFNHADPFFWCMLLYVGVFILACCSWLGWRGFFWPAAMGAMAVIAVFHTFGIVSRVYLTGWGPITNLYSAATFIGWAAVLLALGLELIYRNGVGAAAGAVIGFASLITAHFLGLDGDMMRPIQAVLMTKFWLWTHVPCEALGYTATILAGVLATAYVLLGLLTNLLDEPSGKALTRMVYAITCFAILFSFVGTILGGIWADYSWGRFWGWDPKENGAILIVLWNAIILHARWAGMVKQRGMMVLAILGVIVTSWSYFGTNLLGIGLHSYGFMEGAATRLVLVWVGTAVMAAVGLIPLRMWRSSAPKAQAKLAAAGANR